MAATSGKTVRFQSIVEEKYEEDETDEWKQKKNSAHSYEQRQEQQLKHQS